MAGEFAKDAVETRRKTKSNPVRDVIFIDRDFMPIRMLFTNIQ